MASRKVGDGDTDPDEFDGPPVEPENASRRIFSRLAKRLQNPRELGGDAMDLMGAFLETSDRAKTEMVKMVAREVRNYLDELKLKEDMRSLLTGHSLEVKMSLSLKPLADAAVPAPAPPEAVAESDETKDEDT
jgi:hypothetical protein